MIHGCSFDASGRQLYLIRRSNEASGSVERMYCDFLKLAHARKPRRSNDGDPLRLAPNCDSIQTEGLPKKALKRIATAAPWTRDGDGWRPDLIASVRRVELWLRGHALDKSAKFDNATAHFLSGEYNRASGFDKISAVESSVDHGSNSVSDRHNDGSNSDSRIRSSGSMENSADDKDAMSVSRDLQQFFCLSANLDALLFAALNGLDDCKNVANPENPSVDYHTSNDPLVGSRSLNQQQRCVSDSRRPCRRFVAVEPSCGDGRILARLCALANSSSAEDDNEDGDQDARKRLSTGNPSSAAAVVDCCVGVELDPAMAETSRAAVTNPAENRALNSGSSLKTCGCPVVCNDFLRTSGRALALALADHHSEHYDKEVALGSSDLHESSTKSTLKRPRCDDYGDSCEQSSFDHRCSDAVEGSPNGITWPPVSRCGRSGSNSICPDDASESAEVLEVLVVGGPPYTDYTAPSVLADNKSSGTTTTSMPDSSTSNASASTSNGLAFLKRGSSSVAAAAANAARMAGDLAVGRQPTRKTPPAMDPGVLATSAKAKGFDETSSLDDKEADYSSRTRTTVSSFRSLPLRFVLHAARPVAQGGLGATRVCYLLPARCAKPAFARAVAEGLRRGPSNDSSCDDGHDSGLHRDALDEKNDGGLAALGWKLQCQPAPEQRFSFRGRLVPQPSVIWVMTRSS